jgi:holo-[acyl-carrier protein] synthase
VAHLRTGVDLIEIARVEAALQRYGQRFLDRIYTRQEQADAQGQAASLAARFAAKEAAAKALGCGIGPVGWLDIEITRDPERRPELVLHGAARQRAQALRLREWSVSLSHSKEYAIALVVASD